MHEPTTFGRRLKAVRALRRLTQDEVAKKSGVPAAMISHYESGVRKTPSADNLVKLAGALKCTTDYLLGQSDELEVPSGRVAATFRRLAEASDDTIEDAVSVIDALLDRERGKEQDREKGRGG